MPQTQDPVKPSTDAAPSPAPYKLYASPETLALMPKGEAERLPQVAQANLVLIYAQDVDREINAIIKERGGMPVDNFPHEQNLQKFYERLDEKYGMPMAVEAIKRIMNRVNPDLFVETPYQEIYKLLTALVSPNGTAIATELNGQKFCLIANGVSLHRPQMHFEVVSGGHATNRDVGDITGWNANTDFHEASHCSDEPGPLSEFLADRTAHKETLNLPDSKKFIKSEDARRAARVLSAAIDEDHPPNYFLEDMRNYDDMPSYLQNFQKAILKQIAKDFGIDDLDKASPQKKLEIEKARNEDPQLRYEAIRKINHNHVFESGSEEDQLIQEYLKDYKEYDALASDDGKIPQASIPQRPTSTIKAETPPPDNANKSVFKPAGQ